MIIVTVPYRVFTSKGVSDAQLGNGVEKGNTGTLGDGLLNQAMERPMLENSRP